jgi:VIT1/CCC1 family predicted Fe2+/Mn2+ transporter
MTFVGDKGAISTLFGLSPDESLSEIITGLVMVLTFTLGASVATSTVSEKAARTMILGAVGCNIAWGLIDAVFYVMGENFVRGRRFRLRAEFRSAADKQSAVAMVRDELEKQLALITTSEEREHLYERIHDVLMKAPAPSVGIHLSDLKGAVGVFLLVLLTAIPAALPFFFVGDYWWAIRISNVLLLALLFIVGYLSAEYTHWRPWKAGLGIMLIGLIMVAVAIPLGG